MPTVNLSAETAQHLKGVLDSAIQAPPEAAAAMDAPPAGVDFCTIWPQAKPILQTIAGIIRFIPGLGSGAGAVLSGLITVGDTVASQTCHTGG